MTDPARRARGTGPDGRNPASVQETEPARRGRAAEDLAGAAEHCRLLEDAVAAIRARHLPLLTRWGAALAQALARGGRLLAAGNGGSAAQAQHLTAELVGRYQAERPPYSAISLHAETSTLTAIGNDYGFEELYARQVAAHGRPGDVLVLLSTSGRSPNLVRAADAGRTGGLTVWAMTGPAPNPLAFHADEALCVGTGPAGTATVQEAHLLAVHLLCEVFDASLARHRRLGRGPSGVAPPDGPQDMQPGGPTYRSPDERPRTQPGPHRAARPP